MKRYRYPKLYYVNQGRNNHRWVLVFGSRPANGLWGLVCERVFLCRVFDEQFEERTLEYTTENGLAPFSDTVLKKLITSRRLKKQVLSKLLVGSL